MQRASMFTAFLTMRRALPSGGIDPSYLNQNVVFDVSPPAPVFLNSRAGLEGRSLRASTSSDPATKS
ncbi:hypothetical protein GJ744_005656 [Endocarpon pusillum]|uniref:Uncharacterized protein n=1 Tax=Endocarpon pusillum TaxID=364733 RepID=A0A8H7A6Y4_9EURO|nr:hypothetical protein GJ744_005656 [Endocarpon pusillum]